MKNYLENRKKAMDWVNSDTHDFALGIAILKDASFKPGVIGVLEKHGSGNHQSDERLMYHMRSFIRCYAHEDEKQDTDMDLGIIDGKPAGQSEGNVEVPSMLSEVTLQKLEAGEYPDAIAGVITKYREAYVSRDQLMKELAALPENNDDDTVEKRRSISDKMKELSDIMDELYPQYESFVKTGKDPDTGDKSKTVTVPADLNSMEVNDLKKLRKSVATKISRAQNMLLYQSETKKEKENPLTDEKKIVKYKTKIENLNKELKDIDMAIAKKG